MVLRCITGPGHQKGDNSDDEPPKKRPRRSIDSEALISASSGCSSTQAGTLLRRHDYGFTGHAHDGTKFTVYSTILQRSRVLHDVFAHNDLECHIEQVRKADFLAWLGYVNHSAGSAPEGDGAEPISKYVSYSKTMAVLKVADFIHDEKALEAACEEASQLTFQVYNSSEVVADLNLDPKVSHEAKRRKLNSGIAGHHCEVQPHYELNDPLSLRLVHKIGQTWIQHHAYTPRLCSRIAGTHCPGRAIPPPLLPLFLMRLPAHLRALALRAHSPTAELRHTLTLPHLKDDYFAATLSAAAGVPLLSSIDVTLECTGCSVVQELHGPGPDNPAGVRKAMRDLARMTTLTSFTVRLAKTSRAPPKRKIFQDAMCFDSFICKPFLPPLGALSRLTHLELHGFGDAGDALSGVLRRLTALCTLRLVRCGLRSAVKRKNRSEEDSKWMIPDALETMCALTELDLSGNRISKFHFGRLVERISRLPLRSLGLADCGLNIWPSLAAMGHVTVARKGTPARRFADLSRIDMSANRIKPKTGYGDRDRRERVSGLFKQLRALDLQRVECPWSTSLEDFLSMLKERGTGLQEFSIGRATPTRGEQAGIRPLIQSWTGLRRLEVDWQGPTGIMTLIGKSPRRVADLKQLEDLRLGNVSFGRPARKPLLNGVRFPLTRLELKDVTFSGRGAEVLAQWIARASKLQVLHIDGMERPRSDKKLKPHAETVLVRGLTALTTLRELKLHWRREFSYGGRVVQNLPAVLASMRGLTSLSLRFPWDHVVYSGFTDAHTNCKALVRAMRVLPAMEELTLRNAPLTKNAVTALAHTVQRMKRLRKLQLWSCLTDMDGEKNEQPIVKRMAKGAMLECEKIAKTARYTMRDAPPEEDRDGQAVSETEDEDNDQMTGGAAGGNGAGAGGVVGNGAGPAPMEVDAEAAGGGHAVGAGGGGDGVGAGGGGAGAGAAADGLAAGAHLENGILVIDENALDDDSDDSMSVDDDASAEQRDAAVVAHAEAEDDFGEL